MDFYLLLKLVILLLEDERSLSYRFLKRQFQLDDAALEDLKFEVIRAKGVAMDKGGEALVWIGKSEPTASASDASQALPTVVASPQIDALPAETPAASGSSSSSTEAGRRQLTVMFCDLVGSTALSTQLDPEDLRDVITQFQDACRVAMLRYEGFIARYMGDGMLVYFGYPQAHEDEAERAVRAGLDVIAAMPDLNLAISRYVPKVSVRVGVATGPVVVGDIVGEGATEEAAVLGETPNLAARLQAIAAPDQLVISEATRRLIGEYFDLKDTGTHVLKGITGKVRAWRVLSEHEADTNIETDDSRSSMPLVGRQEELGLLLRAWEASKESHGHVVLVQGEAGIGKSRLLQALREHAAKDDFTFGTIRCSPFHTNSALHPVIEQLKRVAGWRRDDNEAIKLEKLETALGEHSFSQQEAVRLVGELLSLELPEDRYPPLELTPAAQKQLTLDTIVAWLLEEAERRSVLQVWEDLHWADPSTLELLGLFIEQAPTVPVLHVCTFRPDFAPPWPHRSHMTPITLNRLEPPEMVAIIGHLAREKALPKEVTDHIIAKTDGVPLFVEELTKNLLESNLLLEKSDRYELTGPLSEVAIPDTLQDSLMARLDRIPTGPEVAQRGAVLGREFAYEMLAALPAMDERDLRASLGNLVQAELLYQRGRPPHARYIFKHALIQDAAYQSLLRRTRKNYHREVAELLETRFSHVVAAQPEMVAHHYTEAGLIERALTYWQRAGQLAIERSSNTEGIAHFRKALELISMIQNSEERKGQELAVQSSLGSALMATRGYAAPEVADAYARARDLCQELGDKTQLFPVLWGLWLYYLGKGEHRTARGLGEQLLELAHDADDPTLLLEADLVLGATLFFLGEFKQALEHLDRGIASYDPEEHQELAFRYGNLDPGATCLAYAGCSLCLLGHIDQATRRSQESLQVAEETSHRFTLSRALNWNSQLYQFCRDRETVRELAGRAFKLATESGFPLVLAQAPIMLGWAAIEMEAYEEGIDKIKEGLSAWQSTGAGMYRPYYLGLLAEAYGRCGEPQQGLSVLAEAKSLVEKTDERFYEAELCRLEGTLLLQCDEGHDGRAERSFLAALEVARRQKAKLLELRAAVSLGRLWRDQGRREEARKLVAEVRGWFMEGIDTPDLTDARDLLRDPLEASGAGAVVD